eukprot:5759236-Heterocapsa_arctica.AAC.1
MLSAQACGRPLEAATLSHEGEAAYVVAQPGRAVSPGCPGSAPGYSGEPCCGGGPGSGPTGGRGADL